MRNLGDIKRKTDGDSNLDALIAKIRLFSFAGNSGTLFDISRAFPPAPSMEGLI
ncbi:MAG: hypothetical protein PVF58_13085 [Candidatus Methanofastidiosia archaeon]